MTPAAGTPAPTGTEPEPPFVRSLKIAVVVMGIMIVLGLVGVIARIVYLASSSPRSSAGTAASARIAPATSLAVPVGHVVKQISLSGDRLAIHYDGPAGGGVAIVDLASGHVLGRLQLVPEVPR